MLYKTCNSQIEIKDNSSKGEKRSEKYDVLETRQGAR